jgi:ATP-dependent Clp protease protease subunit
MLNKLLGLVLGVFMVAPVAQAKRMKTIVLKDSNTVALRGPVTNSTVASVQQQLITMSKQLPKKAVIFLYLDTPGGSVAAGGSLIDTARALPQRVVTVTSFAASMGFITAQLLGPRVILPSGVMMSHRASATVSGQTPGELESRATFIGENIEEIEKLVAKRMKLSLSEYKKKIVGEYWTYGAGGKAVKQKAADYVMLARCDASLTGTEVVTVNTFFGPVDVTFSRCPLLTAPLAFNFDQTSIWELPLEKRIGIKNQIKLPFLDRMEFVDRFTLKNNVGVFQ